jgi:hypothetical protein
MIVEDVVEQEDGSAIATLDLTADELRMLVEVGFHKLVADFLAKQDLDKSIPALLKK